MQKILVPTDFSSGSQAAMRVAIRIANETSAQLVVAHVWHVPAYAFGSEPFSLSASVSQQLADDAKQGLELAVDQAKRESARVVAGVLLSGTPPWSRLVEVVEADPDIHAIVVGTHGRTGLQRVLLGSVAEKLVRHAPCSVLAVRGDGAPFTNVLCAVDFSASSQVAVDEAAARVRPGGAGITLLHVVEAPVAMHGTHFEGSFLRDLDRAATAALDALAANLRLQVDVPVRTQLRVGYAGAQILAALDDLPAYDLVVLGSHGRTGLGRALLGSVAEKTVRHAPCPVMIARNRK